MKISIVGKKGGCGKSTVAGNLGGALHSLGVSVKLADCDPQHSLVAWAGLGKGALSEIVRPIDYKRPNQFKDDIRAIESTCKFLILDLPPSLVDVALIAALISDVVLVPVTPSPLDFVATQDTLLLMKEAQAQLGGKKPVIKLIPNRVDGRTNLGKDIAGSLRDLGFPVLEGISSRTAIVEAMLSGQTIHEYAPESESAGEFKRLANVFRRMT